MIPCDCSKDENAITPVILVIHSLLVTMSNSCTLPLLPINLNQMNLIKPEPAIVKVIFVPELSFILEATLEIVGPDCFKLLLNTF